MVNGYQLIVPIEPFNAMERTLEIMLEIMLKERKFERKL